MSAILQSTPGSATDATPESPRPALATSRHAALALLGELDQCLLTALGGVVLRPLHVRTVGLHLPRVMVRRELRLEHFAQLQAERRILDRHHHLDPALEIPLHAVGRADEVLLVAAVPEVVDAAVLQEPADDAHHPH